MAKETTERSAPKLPNFVTSTNGTAQPPKKSVTIKAEAVMILEYSPNINIEYLNPLYSM